MRSKFSVLYVDKHFKSTFPVLPINSFNSFVVLIYFIIGRTIVGVILVCKEYNCIRIISCLPTKLIEETAMRIQTPRRNVEGEEERLFRLMINPHFSNNVETNVGRKFLSLLDKHFPKSSKYHKLFNRNNIKISYSCVPNIEQVTKDHNNAELQAQDEKS